MKSKAVLAILVGTTISLSACGQSAQSAEMTVNEAASSESSLDLNDSVICLQRLGSMIPHCLLGISSIMLRFESG